MNAFTWMLILLSMTFSYCDSSAKEEEREALTQVQTYVGSWKGVGRPKRGSSKGSWTEKVSWTWKFTKDHATLAFSSPKGKYFKSGELFAEDEGDVFILKTVAKDGKTKETFKGSLGKKGLVLTNKKAKSGRPARLTFKTVAGGDRLILTLERKLGGIFTRLGEIGYTREGSGFAKGAKGPECCVTGGLGTTPVTYKGKTYYVCCSGCKDLFDEDPAGCVKAYLKRKAKAKKKQ